MRSTNDLPRSIAQARGAVERARFSEENTAYYLRLGRGWREGAVRSAETARYEWARAAAGLLAWGLS